MEMKAQFLILFLLAGVLASNAYAGNSTNDPKEQEQQKKTVKPKYDFNIFKFFSVPTQQVDSLKKNLTPNKKTLLLTRKELTTVSKKRI